MMIRMLAGRNKIIDDLTDFISKTSLYPTIILLQILFASSSQNVLINLNQYRIGLSRKLRPCVTYPGFDVMVGLQGLLLFLDALQLRQSEQVIQCCIESDGTKKPSLKKTPETLICVSDLNYFLHIAVCDFTLQSEGCAWKLSTHLRWQRQNKSSTKHFSYCNVERSEVNNHKKDVCFEYRVSFLSLPLSYHCWQTIVR